MKLSNYIVAFFLLLFMISCTLPISDTTSGTVNNTTVTDISKYNMKIIPVPPTSNDIIRLIINDDCQYNLLTGVKRTGNTIDIEKHFNSLMKIACVLRTDTIQIGKLPIGTYNVNYKLIDLSTFVKDPISFAISFNLSISK